jgi:putative tricarboxylic transport membrane protein
MKRVLKLLQPELFFTFLLMVLSIVIIIVSLRYGFGALRRPGPGLYPFFLGLFILPLSIALIILGLKSKSSEPLFTKSGLKTFLLMVITFCLWIITMPVLGYVLVTFAVAFAFCKIMKLEGWLKPLALSIATALFIYLLFDVWLYIDLPRGILGM